MNEIKLVLHHLLVNYTLLQLGGQEMTKVALLATDAVHLRKPGTVTAALLALARKSVIVA